MTKKAKKIGGTKGGAAPAESKAADAGLYHQMSKMGGGDTDKGRPSAKGHKKHGKSPK